MLRCARKLLTEISETIDLNLMINFSVTFYFLDKTIQVKLGYLWQGVFHAVSANTIFERDYNKLLSLLICRDQCNFSMIHILKSVLL